MGSGAQGLSCLSCLVPGRGVIGAGGSWSPVGEKNGRLSGNRQALSQHSPGDSRRIPHSVFRPSIGGAKPAIRRLKAKAMTCRDYAHEHFLLPAGGYYTERANSEVELVSFYRTSEKFYYA